MEARENRMEISPREGFVEARTIVPVSDTAG